MLSELCLVCRCSSVVEHVIGNDGVVSPILISGTINKKASLVEVFLLMHIGGKKRTDGGNVSPELRSPSEFWRGGRSRQ